MNHNIKKSLNFTCKHSCLLFAISACAISLNLKKSEATIKGNTKPIVSPTASISGLSGAKQSKIVPITGNNQVPYDIRPEYDPTGNLIKLNRVPLGGNKSHIKGDGIIKIRVGDPRALGEVSKNIITGDGSVKPVGISGNKETPYDIRPEYDPNGNLIGLKRVPVGGNGKHIKSIDISRKTPLSTIVEESTKIDSISGTKDGSLKPVGISGSKETPYDIRPEYDSKGNLTDLKRVPVGKGD